MNIYASCIIISLILYFVIGNVVGRKVKDANDYYVAGRNAPTILITGSLVASFLGTGMFLGDCGEAYMGFLIPVLTVSIMATAGYPLGSALFGRFVRRSEALTIPEYFSRRFCDPRMQKLAGIIVVVICFIYMLSVMDGLSTLMAQIIPFDRKICLVIAWVSFTFFTVFAGSGGVLLTDTIMFGVFTAAIIICVPCIAQAAGGWFPGIETLTVGEVGVKDMLSFGGNLEWMYDTPMKNFAWSVTYGIVWMLVVSVSPWQSSRYLMAKNEHVVIRSGMFACVGVLIVNTLVLFAAAMVRVANPGVEPYSAVMVWAAMNLMPIAAGILLLTGIVAAGISSASTFLSLVGFSVVNDIMKVTDSKKSLRISRTAMLIVSVMILMVSLVKPPMVWWMTQISSSIVAASWGAVAFGSIWWKRITKKGAFWGMLLGFLGAFCVRVYTLTAGTTLPVALDPFWVGIYLSLFGVAAGSLSSQITPEEKLQRDKLFIVPEKEKDRVEIKKTRNTGYAMVATGIGLFLFMVVFYAYPYTQAAQG